MPSGDTRFVVRTSGAVPAIEREGHPARPTSLAAFLNTNHAGIF